MLSLHVLQTNSESLNCYLFQTYYWVISKAAATSGLFPYSVIWGMLLELWGLFNGLDSNDKWILSCRVISDGYLSISCSNTSEVLKTDRYEVRDMALNICFSMQMESWVWTLLSLIENLWIPFQQQLQSAVLHRLNGTRNKLGIRNSNVFVLLLGSPSVLYYLDYTPKNKGPLLACGSMYYL